MALNLSQSSLNFDQLELQIGEHDRIEDEYMDVEDINITEQLESSSNEEHIEPQVTVSSNQKIRNDQSFQPQPEPGRKSVKERLGHRPESVPRQKRLINRDPTNKPSNSNYSTNVVYKKTFIL